MPETIEKVKELKKYITEKDIDIYIEADGGINESTITELKEAGIDIAVVGSAIINAEDYKETIKELKK
ncbi:MAG: hypothetical protein IJ223_00275 [Clostridia bacterium]|nr:hypothetical protein [Clostridia bacterium]